MKKIIGIVIAAVVIGALGFVTWSQITKTNGGVDYSKYDINAVIEGNDDNGGIADHVKGNPNAPILIFEYADYQCSGCASVRNSVDALVEKYGDKLGIVQRSYVLSYHTNGVAAASAAEAAAYQGYWKEMGELLFANQDDWFYSDATKRTAQFSEYFNKATNGKGDLDKFLNDMASEEISKKVQFDMGLGKHVGDISYTPAFFIDGQFIDWANNTNGKSEYVNTEKIEFVDFMSQIIDKKLAELK